MTLPELRQAIDEINHSLIAHFSERLDVARKIARLKKEAGLPVLDEEREKAQMQDLRQLAADYKLDPEVIEKIFTIYVDYSREEMKNL